MAGSIGEILMMRKVLGSQMGAIDESQKECIFQSRCSIQGKVCALIIDGGSCTNVASARLVSKLNLDTKPHPMPYKLQWLSEKDEVCVDSQVEVSFSIGKYEDKVFCDVVPMEACHILLGRPWQYDTKVTHDCFNNKYSFMHHGKKIVLKPLSPSEAREDQKRLREKIAQENMEMQKERETLERETRKSETLEDKESETLKREQDGIAKKREGKRMILAKQPLNLLNCENKIFDANHFVNPKLFSSVKFFLQDFKDETSRIKSNRSLENHCQNLILGTTKIRKKVDCNTSLKDKGGNSEWMVKPFQSIFAFSGTMGILNNLLVLFSEKHAFVQIGNDTMSHEFGFNDFIDILINYENHEEIFGYHVKIQHVPRKENDFSHIEFCERKLVKNNEFPYGISQKNALSKSHGKVKRTFDAYFFCAYSDEFFDLNTMFQQVLKVSQRKEEHMEILLQGKFVFDPGGKIELFITCSIIYSCLFVVNVGSFDLRTNPLQEGGSDENMAKHKDKETLQGLELGGPKGAYGLACLQPNISAQITRQEA